MIKRLIMVLMFLVLASPAFSGGVVIQSNIHRNNSYANLLAPIGLTFFADYRDGISDAVYSDGPKEATFTASRSSGNPATVVNADGTISTVATDDTPRFVGGYYDETGFHAANGLLLEGSSTNYITYSDDFTNAAWVSTDVTIGGGTVSTPIGDKTTNILQATADNADLTFNTDGALYGKTFSLFLKKSSGSGTVDLSADTSIYTSCVLPEDTWVRCFSSNIDNEIYTQYDQGHWIQSGGYGWTHVAGNTTSILVVRTPLTLGVEYTRTVTVSGMTTGTLTPYMAGSAKTGITGDGTYSYTATSTGSGQDSFAPSSGFDGTIVYNGSNPTKAIIRLPYSGDEVYAFGATFTNDKFPTSYIPTSGTSVTRNKETLTYLSGGNNMVHSYGPPMLSFNGNSSSSFSEDGSDYVKIPASATANATLGATTYSIEMWAARRGYGEGLGYFLDSFGAGSTGITLNTSSGVAFSATISTDSTNAVTTLYPGTIAVGGPLQQYVVTYNKDADKLIKVYINGVLKTAQSHTHGTGNLDGDQNIYLGNRTQLDKTMDGFIQRVRLFRDKALTQTEVDTLYGGGTFIQGQLSPVSGVTAEYNFQPVGGSTVLTSLLEDTYGNHGTIVGPTWTYYNHNLSIALKYRPISLPEERSFENLRHLVFSMDFDVDASVYTRLNRYAIRSTGETVYTTGLKRTLLVLASDSNLGANWQGGYDPNIAFNSDAFTRYNSYTLIGTFYKGGGGTTDIDDINTYSSGTLIDSTSSSEGFWQPGGDFSDSTTFNILPDDGQSIFLESFVVFDHTLTADEVTSANTALQ